VHEGVIREADEYVTHLATTECHLPRVPKGSVVVAITGQGKTLGNSALLALDACVSQHLAYITPSDPAIASDFLLAYLQSRYADLRRAGSAGGSTKAALTCRFLGDFQVPLPSIEDQRMIAAMHRTLDERIKTARERAAMLERLFESTLNMLMSGKGGPEALVRSEA